MAYRGTLAWLVGAQLAAAILGVRPGIPLAHAGDGIQLAVEVGRTVERRVGNANGSFCDDPSLVETSLVTRDDINVWIVRGVKPGTTQCRVGTDVTRTSYVFEVTVKLRAKKR